jgi:ketol-acid reductoisomerase
MAQIFNLMASNGCFKQMSHHSTTSQYGAFSRSERYFTPAVDAHFRGVARQCFHTDIAGGHFVEEWTHGGAAAEQKLRKLVQAKLGHAMSEVEDRVLPLTKHMATAHGSTHPATARFSWSSFVAGVAVGALAVLAVSAAKK